MTRAALAAAILVAWAAAAPAAEPIPLQAGTYCGRENARIVVDVDHDRVQIDGMVCAYPVIAADHLQSDLCSTPKGENVARNFDFSVVGRQFAHAGSWFSLCGSVPANPADPSATAPPKAGG